MKYMMWTYAILYPAVLFCWLSVIPVTVFSMLAFSTEFMEWWYVPVAIWAATWTPAMEYLQDKA